MYALRWEFAFFSKFWKEFPKAPCPHYLFVNISVFQKGELRVERERERMWREMEVKKKKSQQPIIIAVKWLVLVRDHDSVCIIKDAVIFFRPRVSQCSLFVQSPTMQLFHLSFFLTLIISQSFLLSQHDHTHSDFTPVHITLSMHGCKYC